MNSKGVEGEIVPVWIGLRPGQSIVAAGVTEAKDLRDPAAFMIGKIYFLVATSSKETCIDDKYWAYGPSLNWK